MVRLPSAKLYIIRVGIACSILALTYITWFLSYSNKLSLNFNMVQLAGYVIQYVLPIEFGKRIVISYNSGSSDEFQFALMVATTYTPIVTAISGF
jgi:hypothetical protein